MSTKGQIQNNTAVLLLGLGPGNSLADDIGTSGYEIHLANNLAEAKPCLENNSFRAIITESGFINSGFVPFVLEVRKKTPELPVIILGDFVDDRLLLRLPYVFVTDDWRSVPVFSH